MKVMPSFFIIIIFIIGKPYSELASEEGFVLLCTFCFKFRATSHYMSLFVTAEMCSCIHGDHPSNGLAVE